VTLQAVPNEHYRFDHWEGDVTGTASPVDLLMDGNKAVVAVFSLQSYPLTITISGMGTVTPDPASTDGKYTYGSSVQLTANPSTGYRFDHWVGAIPDSVNPDIVTVAMDGPKSVEAVFTALNYSLTIGTSGDGIVTPDPLPDNGTYSYGTQVTLTPTAGTGYTFDHWQGDLSGNSNPATITIDGDKNVTAVFVHASHTLATTIVGEGSITAEPMPDNGKYPFGTQVTLEATAGAGYAFDHWQGDLTGNNNPAIITIDGDKNVTAVFLKTDIDLQAFLIKHININWDKKDTSYANFHASGRLQLPQGIDMTDLMKTAEITINISGETVKDTVIFKSNGKGDTTWTFKDNKSKLSDYGLNLETVTISWAPANGRWAGYAGFNIQGEFKMPGIDGSAQPPDVTLTIAFPHELGYDVIGTATVTCDVSGRDRVWQYNAHEGWPDFPYDIKD